ncbi:transmembrane protein 43 homolog isoform X2 [Anabrus simplex]
MSLLFWNEGRNIQATRSLEEAMDAVIPLHFAAKPKEENNGHLVHLTGPVEVGEPLTEMEYGVSVPAVKLKRRVQMYQWIEEEIHDRENEQGVAVDETYSYSTHWKDKLIDSKKFHQRRGHHNPLKLPLRSKMYISEQVTIGFFSLSPELKEKFDNFVVVTSDERPERRDIKMHSGLYYHSQDVWNPEVGDIRLQFSYAGKAGDVVTVVGMQAGSEIRPYVTVSGREVLILREGSFSVKEIFLQEHTQNPWITWLLRILGWLMMCQGASCFSHILQVLLCRYSLLHEVLLGFGSLHMAVSLPVALFVIAIAWVWYRPIFGFAVASLAVLPFLCSAVKLYVQDYHENQYRHLHSP